MAGQWVPRTQRTLQARHNRERPTPHGGRVHTDLRAAMPRKYEVASRQGETASGASAV